MGDVYEEGDLVVESVEDFIKEDAKDVAEGLKKLGEALQKLPDAMIQCKSAVSDAEALINAFKQFTSPVSFAYHVGKDLMVNGV